MHKKLNPTATVVCIYFILLALITLRFNIKIYGDEPEIAETAINIIFGYKQILAGKISIAEPQSYLYGSIYTYLLTPVGFLTYHLTPFINKSDNFYLLFRLVNVGISIGSILLFYKILKQLNSSWWPFLFLLMLNPVYLSRSLFLNQDMLSVFLILLSFNFLGIYLKSNNKYFKYLYFITTGLVISSKITYALPSLLTYIFLLFNSKAKIKDLLLTATLTVIGFAVSFPFALINLNEYVARISMLKTLEAGVALDSYNPNPLFYLIRILLFYGPILLLLALQYKDTYKQFKKYFNKSLYPYIFIYTTSLVLFFSLQIRKTDRWGLFVYIGFLLLFLPIFKILRKKNIILAINIATLSIISWGLISFFTTQDPRVQLKDYLESNNSFKYLVISEHGNMLNINNLDSVNLIRHRIYENKDNLDTYTMSKDYLTNYDYLVISTGAIRDFNNKYSLKKYPNLNTWKSTLDCGEPIKTIGVNKITFEPQIGFVVYNTKDLSACIKTTGP